jgi:hypothetical protein
MTPEETGRAPGTGLRAETGEGAATGQKTPPIVYEMYLVNAQITEEINKLLQACPD